MNDPNPNAREDQAQWEVRNPDLVRALKERYQQEIAEHTKRRQRDNELLQRQTELELEESLAQIVYEQAIVPTARHCHTEAPRWVAGGNSIAQDDARAAARAIIRRWPREEQVIAENIQRQLLRRIDSLEQELERKYPRLTVCGVVAKSDTPEAAATARGKERLAQQLKRKMLENLDRSCDATTAEVIQLVDDWIAQALREEARR